MPDTLTTDIVAAGYARCERIAARDKPHLYAAAQRFIFPESRRAFAATYASMRLIDDFVDDIPRRRHLSGTARAAATRHIDNWLALVGRAHQGDPANRPLWRALSDSFTRFTFPLTPWENLAQAMRSDLTTPHFADWDHLLRYMEGASVAPAVVFSYLVLMRPDEKTDRFTCLWPYEQVLECTRDLAIFCYCVHILRDVAVDLALGEEGLVYLPVAELAAFGLTIADLQAMKEAGQAGEAYRRLAEAQAGRAIAHLSRGRVHLRKLLLAAPEGNAIALQLLVETYVKVLEELRARRFDVFAPL